MAMERRTALGLLLAAAGALPLAAAAGCRRRVHREAPRLTPTEGPGGPALPALFVAHGSPMLLDDDAWVRELATWARALPRPRAILVLSAHWTRAPITLGATRT